MNVSDLQQKPQLSPSPLNHISPRELYAKINEKVNLILESSPQKVYRLLALACNKPYEKKRSDCLRENRIELHTIKGGTPLTIRLSDLSGNRLERIIKRTTKDKFIELGKSKQIAKQAGNLAVTNYRKGIIEIKDLNGIKINSVKDLFFSEVRYLLQSNNQNAILRLICDIQRIMIKQNLIKAEKEKGSESDSLIALFQHEPTRFRNIPNILDDQVALNHTLALITLLCDDFYKKTELSLEKDNPIVIACAFYAAMSFVNEESLFQVDYLKHMSLNKSGPEFMEAMFVFLKTIDWKVAYSNQEIEERLTILKEHSVYSSIMTRRS